jgi:hypothetical protein
MEGNLLFWGFFGGKNKTKVLRVMSNKSLLEAHLNATRDSLSASLFGKAAIKKDLGRTEGEKNFVVKARKDLKIRQQKVEAAQKLIVLSQPKKKSRKLLAKLVKEQKR